MSNREYENCFLKPEITQAGEYQVFTMKGKDTRGYDWKMRLAPITEQTYPGDIPVKVDADRVELYVGSKPEEIEKISGEMEIKMGPEGEAYTIDNAKMVYIPKGMPVERKIVKKPEAVSWLLSFNLTPAREEVKVKNAANGLGDKKYSHLILDDCVTPAFYPMNSPFLAGNPHWAKLLPGPVAQFAFYYDIKPGVFTEAPHTHKAEEHLMFVSSDPKDMKNLGATIEVAFGDDWEKYSFDYSTFIRFPAGVQHCPIFVRNLQRPFFIGHFWAGGEPPHFDNVT